MWSTPSKQTVEIIQPKKKTWRLVLFQKKSGKKITTVIPNFLSQLIWYIYIFNYTQITIQIVYFEITNYLKLWNITLSY